MTVYRVLLHQNIIPILTSDYVILLHGAFRRKASMASLEKALQNAGYTVFNLDYPSRTMPINDIAETILAPFIAQHCANLSKKIHFVTHSMGGIIVRSYLQHHMPENLGRVVMLAPPNHGSEIADRLKNTAIFKKLYGPAGQQLITGPGSFIEQLPPAHYELGIIAGDLPAIITYFLIPGKNDGLVSVSSTKLEGMTDHITIHMPHSCIMWGKKVRGLVFAFLEKGKFMV